MALGILAASLLNIFLDSLSSLGLMALPDSYIIALLWADTHPVWAFVMGLALALAGGVGWGLARVGGARRALAGGALATLLVLAIPAGIGLAEWAVESWWGHPGLIWRGSGGPWVLLGLPFLFLWAWAAAPQGKWHNFGMGLALWGLVGISVGSSVMIALDRLSTHSDRLHPAWLGSLWLLGLLPLILLLGFFPASRGLTRGGLRLGMVACLAIALGLPQLLPPARPPLPKNFYDAEVGAREQVGLLFPSFAALGPAGGRWSNGRKMAAAEGLAALQQVPPPGLGRWTPGLALLPNYILLKADRVNLDIGRSYLRAVMASNPDLIDALVYRGFVATDPLASEEDVAALGSFLDMFPAQRGAGRVFAQAAYGRGDVAMGDAIMAEVEPILSRGVGLLRRADACTTPMECDLDDHLGRVYLEKDWPLFVPPHDGNLRVKWNPGTLGGLLDDLLIAPLPLRNPERPRYLDSEETYGPWSASWMVQLHPAAGNETLLEGMPVGRYALEVAFREHKHPGLEVWVVGLPREEIVIGPGQWEWETTLTLLPAYPVPFTCANGMLVWDAYEGASTYLVEAWGKAEMQDEIERTALATLSGTTIGVSEMLAGAEWPLYGFRVVSIDAAGKEIIRADPLSTTAMASLAPSEEGCMVGADHVDSSA